MACTSPAAPELTDKPVHVVELNSFGSESSCDSSPSTRIQGVTVSSVWMAIDEEDALAAGELAIDIIVYLT